MLTIIEKAAARSCRLLAMGGFLILLAFATLSVADGLMREFLKQPIDLVRDLGCVVVAIAVGCCMPAGLYLRAHISVRLLEGVVGQRAGKVFDAVASVLLAGAMLAIANEFIAYAGKTKAGHQATFLLQVQTWPFWYVVTAILWIAAVVQLIVMVVMIARVFGREPLDAPVQG